MYRVNLVIRAIDGYYFQDASFAPSVVDAAALTILLYMSLVALSGRWRLYF